jgi:uncharacterized protein YciW
MIKSDIIDGLAGVERGSPVDSLRDKRKDARFNAQKSSEALFETKSLDGVTVQERHAIAAFVAGLHRDTKALAFYKRGLVGNAADASVVEAIHREAARGSATGPYGRYPEGPLSVEDKAPGI